MTAQAQLANDLLADIRTPMLRRLHAYWEERRRGRTMPARRDLDPTEFKFALGHVLLIDVHYDPLRFRFRLHGAELAMRAGYDMTGKTVEDLPHPENRAVFVNRCHDLVRSCEPFALRSERVLDGRNMRYEVVWLPLSEDGERVTMLLGGLVYLDPP